MQRFNSLHLTHFLQICFNWFAGFNSFQICLKFASNSLHIRLKFVSNPLLICFKFVSHLLHIRLEVHFKLKKQPNAGVWQNLYLKNLSKTYMKTTKLEQDQSLELYLERDSDKGIFCRFFVNFPNCLIPFKFQYSPFASV